MPSGFLDDDGDAGQVLRRRGIRLLVRGVEGQGQHRMLARVGGAQRDKGLFGQRRIAVGLLRGGDKGGDVPQQLRVHGSLDERVRASFPGAQDSWCKAIRVHGRVSGRFCELPERLRIVVISCRR